MKMLTLPRLKMAELQSFTESFLPIVQSLTELAPQVQLVIEAHKTFKDGMLKIKANSDKKTLDRTRDEYISGLLYTVIAESAFPHSDADVLEILNKVEEITERYGFQLNKLPYNEQSAQTDNLLAELEALNLAAVGNIARWIEPIKEANETFKIAADEYLLEQAELEGTVSASEAAPALQNAINDVLTLLFAHVQINRTDALSKAYQELYALIDSYK